MGPRRPFQEALLFCYNHPGFAFASFRVFRGE